MDEGKSGRKTLVHHGKEYAMLNIGCHLSTSKGFYEMGRNALKINANTFQFFTRTPRGSKAKAIDPEDTKALLKLMKENNFTTYIGNSK